MFIPRYVFWIAYAVLVLVVSHKVGKRKNDYDFFSPLLGAAVLVIGTVFSVAYFLGSLFG